MISVDMNHKFVKRISPVLFLDDGKLLGYKNGSIYYFDCILFRALNKKLLFTNLKEYILYRLPMIRRLFRLGIRTSIQINNEIVLLFLNKKIYELNIITNKVSNGYEPETGVRPLYFSNIDNDIKGFNSQVVFGGYLSNSTKKEVHIYKRVGVDSWDVVFTFDKGEINHIHNIIPDKYNDCVWIFTGDFDKSAAIWKVTDNFKNVERVVSNSQIYRGCIGFPTKEGLIYATDAPFHDNTIRILKQKGNNWVSEKICDIDGSSIYGCKYKDKFVFSTTVEPDGRGSSLLKSMFYQKRGVGIKDNFTHIYIGNYEKNFKDIFKLEKDIWPFIFQFGTIKFPSGENNTDYLVFEPVATKKYDQKLVKLKIE
jgi:hypothetical protein